MHTTQNHLQIQSSPYQHFNGVFHRNEGKNPKTHMEQQRPPQSQSNPEKE